MTTLRVAMLGYGFVAREHAAAIRQASDVECAAVIGPRREPAERFAAENGGLPVFADLDSAVRATAVDAAIITSPTDLHLPQAREALSAGLHVLVEFPLYGTNNEMERLAALARQHGRVLAVAHTSRYLWAFTRTKELLETGKFGTCKSVSYRRLLHRPVGTGAKGATRRWEDDVLVHHAAHVLDLCRFWFGEVVLVDVVAPKEPSGHRNCGLMLHTPGGAPICAVLTYDASYAAMQATLIMQGGVIDTHGFERVQIDGKDDTADRPTSEDEALRQAVLEQDAAFFSAALGRQPSTIPPEESLALSRLINQVVSRVTKHHHGSMSNPPRDE